MKKRLLILGCLIAAVALGWFWLERTTRPAPETPPVASKPVTSVSPPAPPTFEAKSTTNPAPGTTTGFSSNPDPTAEPVQGTIAEPAPVLTAGDILAEPDEDYVRVAKKLSALVRDERAPMADREEALAHTLNLSAGNEAEVLTPLVVDPALPDPFAETILAEALNRPLAYQADLYLAALAARKSPEMQTLIREHLTFLTGGEDLGGDPVKWRPALDAAKKNWE